MSLPRYRVDLCCSTSFASSWPYDAGLLWKPVCIYFLVLRLEIEHHLHRAGGGGLNETPRVHCLAMCIGRSRCVDIYSYASDCPSPWEINPGRTLGSCSTTELRPQLKFSFVYLWGQRGTREIAHWLRPLAALPEDLGQFLPPTW